MREFGKIYSTVGYLIQFMDVIVFYCASLSDAKL